MAADVALQVHFVHAVDAHQQDVLDFPAAIVVIGARQRRGKQGQTQGRGACERDSSSGLFSSHDEDLSEVNPE